MSDRKSIRGLNAYLSGAAAEECVERLYVDKNFTLAARRWRGGGGELDLVFRDGATVVFVEVKKAKSLDIAATRISSRQRQRIFNAASAFVAGEPKGQLTEMRFDVALVAAHGESQIIENALFEG